MDNFDGECVSIDQKQTQTPNTGARLLLLRPAARLGDRTTAPSRQGCQRIRRQLARGRQPTPGKENDFGSLMTSSSGCFDEIKPAVDCPTESRRRKVLVIRGQLPTFFSFTNWSFLLSTSLAWREQPLRHVLKLLHKCLRARRTAGHCIFDKQPQCITI